MRLMNAAARFVFVLLVIFFTVLLGGADEPAGGGCGGMGPSERTTVTTDDEGGANANEQAAGNNDRGGSDLSDAYGAWDAGGASALRESSVDPSGTYFLSNSNGRLVIWRLDSKAFEAACLAAAGFLSTEIEHTVRVVPGISSPARIAFGFEVRRFYVSSSTSNVVRAFDPDTLTRLWATPMPDEGHGMRLYVSPDDRYLAVAGSDTLKVLDAASGAIVASWQRGGIVDVDFTSDSRRVLITPTEEWHANGPTTRLVLLDVRDGSIREIPVPNCASNLVVTPDGQKAFLAPTRCGFDTTTTTVEDLVIVSDDPWAYDPVSVVDLKRERFVRNLPGFGPVALTEDGRTGLAFVNTDHLDLTLFDDPSQVPSAAWAVYHAMIFDTTDYTFVTVPIGDVLPRYAMLPDGRVALLDGDRTTTCTEDGVSYECGNDDYDNRTRVLDVATRQIEELAGPPVSLNQYAVTSDATRVFLLQNQSLYTISVPRRSVTRARTDYAVQTLNITPDGERLLLLDVEGVLHVFDTHQAKTLYTVTPPEAE